MGLMTHEAGKGRGGAGSRIPNILEPVQSAILSFGFGEDVKRASVFLLILSPIIDCS